MYRFLLLLILVTGCASIQPPPGGEEDKTPPIIIETQPNEQALNVSRSPKVRFQFEHNVDRASFMQAITITPYVPGVVKYNWSGYDEVELELPDTLRENTTYILSLSKDLKTQRAGNLAEPFQLIFSTGSQIDTGLISGQLFSPLVVGAPADFKNTSIFAYDLSVHNSDTLKIGETRPDYITQPNESGLFTFKALKIGHRYRFLAIQDEFRNRLYDESIDAFGIPTSDLLLDKPTESGVSIRMMPKVDTSKLSIDDYEVIDRNHFKIMFSRPLDSSSVGSEHFELRDSNSQQLIPLLAAYRVNIEKHGGEITFVTEKLEDNKTYRLTVIDQNIRDISKIVFDSSHSTINISTNSLRDTFPLPKFEGFGIIDSSRGVRPHLDLILNFTDAVDTAVFDRQFTIVDSSNRSVPLKLQWLDGIRLRVQASLDSRAFYGATVQIGSVLSPVMREKQGIDSTVRVNFFTGDVEEFGTISGEIFVSDSILHSGHLVVQLVSSPSGVLRRVRPSQSKGTYIFNAVPKGKYRIQAWMTRRTDDSYDGGQPIPWQFALPSGDYPDLIDVRPKWTVEHVDFSLR